jgi:hypothetical protein
MNAARPIPERCDFRFFPKQTFAGAIGMSANGADGSGVVETLSLR